MNRELVDCRADHQRDSRQRNQRRWRRSNDDLRLDAHGADIQECGHADSVHSDSGDVLRPLRSTGAVVSTTQNGSGTVTGRSRVDYRYTPQGIRTISVDWTDANLDGTFAAGERTGSVEYLIENANFTGYQQTILETVKNAAGQATKRITYTFGVDEITQTTTLPLPGGGEGWGEGETLTFAHDGRGSVRALFGAAAAIAQVYTYSAYGELLAIHNGSGTLQPLASSLTSVLYNGEGLDARTGLYNMRARWYSAANARWERLDPFNGNPHDPFSFNKYGFVHGNPVMGADPTGELFGLAGISLGGFAQISGRVVAYKAAVGAIAGGALSAISESLANDRSLSSIAGGALQGVVAGLIFGAMAGFSESAALIVGLTMMVYMRDYIVAAIKDDWNKGNHAKAIFDTGVLMVAVPLMFSRLAVTAATAIGNAANSSMYARVAALMAYSRFAKRPGAFADTAGRKPAVAAGAYDPSTNNSAGGLSGVNAAPDVWHPVVYAKMVIAEAIWATNGRNGNRPGHCAEWRAINELALKIGGGFQFSKRIVVEAIGTGENGSFPLLETAKACKSCYRFLNDLVTLVDPS